MKLRRWISAAVTALSLPVLAMGCSEILGEDDYTFVISMCEADGGAPSSTDICCKCDQGKCQKCDGKDKCLPLAADEVCE